MIKYGLDTSKTYTNNSGCKFRVVDFISSNKVRILFESSYETVKEARDIREGSVNDRLSPSIFGVGIYDRKRANSKIFQLWQDMIKRCYDERVHEIRATYKGCSVSKEWLTYSNFEDWVLKQDYKAKQLDKDIITYGNKEYSADKCAFVTSNINSLMNDCGANRGELKIGVSTNGVKFQACCSNGKCKTISLGTFDNEEDAHIAYCKYKSTLIRRLAKNQEPRVKKGLIFRAAALESRFK